jgi:hypothetical protein
LKKLKVKVRATLDASGQIDFEVDGKKAKDSRLKLDKDSGAHSIDFDLHDQTGRQLQFNQADPIWAGDNVPCPPAPGLNSDQLSIAGCVPQTLTVTNTNSGSAREVRYQLNFVDAGGTPQSCDPIIENGGGQLM